MKRRGKSILKFVTPSVNKEEALPMGDGQIGVLVFGGAKRETVRFCHVGLFETNVIESGGEICNFDCDKNCSKCRCNPCPYAKDNLKDDDMNFDSKTRLQNELKNDIDNMEGDLRGNPKDDIANNLKPTQPGDKSADMKLNIKSNLCDVRDNLNGGDKQPDIKVDLSDNINNDLGNNLQSDAAMDVGNVPAENGLAENDFPDVSVEFACTKKLVEEGRYVEAQNLFANKILSLGTKSEEKRPVAVCNLEFDFEVACRVTDFYRALDMQTGSALVHFEDEKGTVERNSFVSCKRGVFASKIVAAGGKKVNFSFWVANAMEYDKNDEVDFSDNVMTFVSHKNNGKKCGLVLKFCLRGGSFEIHGKKVTIFGAEEVVIVAKPFVCDQMDKNCIPNVQNDISRAKCNFEDWFLEQKEEFCKRNSFPTLDLGGRECDCVEKMILLAKSGDIAPDFVEKLCMFGNYLFAIAGKSLFDFPCGMFDLCLGQTNHYLQLESLMLPTFFGGNVGAEAFFDKYFEKLSNYENLCKKMFGFDGIFLPSLQKDDGNPSLIEGQNLCNNNVAGLICIYIYKHYLRTLDVKFLDKAYPFLQKTGQFYANFLVENKQNKTLESPYGISPYSRPKGKVFYLSPNPMVDFATARSVFKILTTVCQILGKQEEIEKFEQKLSLVPDVQVDNFGLIKEYNLNGLETDQTSPFISHLVPYCVGTKRFDAKKDYETLVANSVKSRFVNSTGKYRSNDLCRMALTLFSCGDGVGGYEILKTLVKNFATSNLMFSLFDHLGQGVGLVGDGSERPFDTNIMLFPCIKNMFVKSCGSDIFLFDSFPKELKKCSIKGVVLDGKIGCEVYVLARGILRLRLKSSCDTCVNVFMPCDTKRVKVRGATFDYQQNAILGMELRKNKKKKIKVYFER